MPRMWFSASDLLKNFLPQTLIVLTLYPPPAGVCSLTGGPPARAQSRLGLEETRAPVSALASATGSAFRPWELVRSSRYSGEAYGRQCGVPLQSPGSSGNLWSLTDLNRRRYQEQRVHVG